MIAHPAMAILAKAGILPASELFRAMISVAVGPLTGAFVKVTGVAK